MIKKNFIFAGFLILILSLSVVSFPLLADAQNSSDKGKPQVVSGIGKVPGKDLYVDVLVLVPEGSDPQDMVAKALAKQGARPIGNQQFSETGLVWDQFKDNNLDNDFVKQNYLPTGEQVDGLTVLTNTHNTWNGVQSSSFEFMLGDTNVLDRCPSLVLECYLGQPFDGNNDVGWVELEGSSTLGVAWYGTSTDEVDIALDIGHPWFTDGQVYFDVETVLLHENGHGLGLSHSNVFGSIMNASYDTIQRTLGTDDINGISALYPTPVDPTPADPAITITSPTTTTVNGKITISASVVGVADPTVYFKISGPNGYEHISDNDSNEPFAISIHTKNWDSGSYLIEAFETSESQYDNKTVEKEGKTTDGSGGGGGGGSWDCTAKYHPKKCP